MKWLLYLAPFLISFALMGSVDLEQSDLHGITNPHPMENLLSGGDHNHPLLARRSGGRIGGRSFSRRSSSRSTKSLGSSSRSSRSYGGTSYGSRRRSSGGFFFFGGSSRGGGSGFGTVLFLIILLIVIGGIVYAIRRSRKVGSSEEESFTTMKLQFGLHATAVDFRRKIKDMAMNMDFDDEEDLKMLVSESTMLLTQHKDYIKYGHAEASETTKNIEKAETYFDDMIHKEREKLSQETFTKLQGRSISEQDLAAGNRPDFMDIKEYIVFSMVVSYANAKISLPDDYEWSGYRELLKVISLIPTKNIVAAEIIWSPDAEEDVLTEDDITQYYPDMKLL